MPKPYFRKQTASYYVQIDGKQHSLGKDEAAAWEQYHCLMANRQPVEPQTKVADLLARFLDFCEKKRSPLSYVWYRKHLISFAESLPAKLTVANLKAFHVTDWMDRRYAKCGDNYKNGAVRAVMRCFNWGFKQGHIPANPIKGVERPAPHGRIAYITPEQWATLMAAIKETDPFIDVLRFMRATGCRPQELRAIEARHFVRDIKRIVFPVKESKGKKVSRVIPLNGEAMAMISRLALKYPEGKLFRTTHGTPWGKTTLSSRFTKLRGKLKIKDLFAYAIRHSYVTDALKRGVHPVTLAVIVGHKDPTMILTIYQHVGLDSDHVDRALALATGEVPPANVRLA